MKTIKEVTFWLVVLLALVIGFGFRIGDYAGAFLFTTFLLPVLVGSSYTFSEFLIPKFLLNRQYLKFALYAFYTLVISLNLTTLVMVLSFIVLANYRYENMLSASRDVLGLALVILIISLIKSSWKMVKQLFSQENELQKLTAKDQLLTTSYLNVKADRMEHRIALADITYVESLSDYIKINLKSGKSVVTRERISAISDRLPANFLRIHRSYLINIEQVIGFNAETVNLNDNELPIGRKYKAEVKQVLQHNKS